MTANPHQSGRKTDRQEAIRREIERREQLLAVPPEKQVYVLDQHHEDQGGPSSLCLREFRDQKGFCFDDWRRRLAGAPADWMTPEIVCSADRRPDSEPGDFGEFSGLFLFSSRAHAALGYLLSRAGVLLPVTSHLGDYVGYRLDAVVDALDETRAAVNWSETVDHRIRWASSIQRYAFHTERLGDSPLFRLPVHWQPLVLQEFMQAVRDYVLKGFRFCRVWPNSGTGLWWQQTDNWC